jgi:hypothetical protein
MTNEQTQATVSALIRERGFYEQRGETARAKEVSEQLKLLGADAQTGVQRATTRANPAAKRAARQ